MQAVVSQYRDQVELDRDGVSSLRICRIVARDIPGCLHHQCSRTGLRKGQGSTVFDSLCGKLSLYD